MLYDAHNEYHTALIWSCSEILGFPIIKSMWVLSRSTHISDTDYNALLDYAASTGIDLKSLGMHKTNQTGCPVNPESRL